MKPFKKILIAASLALAVAASAADAGTPGTPTTVSKCQDFACQN